MKLGRIAAILVSLVVALPAAAVSVQSWSASAARQFADGTLDGTAIDEEGSIRLALRRETLWGPGEGIVWDVAPASPTAAYVALSSPARLLRVEPGREPETLWDTEQEHLIAAIAADGAGGVFFGVSPEGQVYHATASGEVSALDEVGALFVWALAHEADGTLWIGTGMPGLVLRRDPDGRTETVFETGDDPVRCLAVLPGGGVLAGTGGRGQVVRIGADGRPFVVFDADEKEIVSIDVADNGNAFVLAARGSKQVRSSRKKTQKAVQVETVRAEAPPPADDGGDDGSPDAPSEPSSKSPKRLSTPPGASLYRIATNGDVRRIWKSTREVPFGVLHTDDGGVLVATGDKGRVIRLDEHGRAALVLEIPSDQASTVARGGDGHVMIGGTTDARLERLGPGVLDVGRYLTPAIDASTITDWGRLHWEADVPSGARLQLYARGGNTAEPDETWTEWVELDTKGKQSAETGLPGTRWFQARAELEPSRSGESPAIRRLELHYLPRNRPPVIGNVTVEPSGIVWTQTPVQTSRPRGPLIAQDPVTRRAVESLGKSKTRPIRKSYEHGARTASWKAEDPDDDSLLYSLAIRREDRTEWVPLATDINTPYFGWDTRGLPDGLYRVRLTVVDSPDNPQGKEHRDQRMSTVFRVDNTRPFLGDPEIRREPDIFEVGFVASDPGGNVAAVEVAVDNGDWQPLDPLDGVADSPEERYEMAIERGSDMRSLRVRVTDGSGNLGGDAWALDPDR